MVIYSWVHQEDRGQRFRFAEMIAFRTYLEELGHSGDGHGI